MYHWPPDLNAVSAADRWRVGRGAAPAMVESHMHAIGPLLAHAIGTHAELARDDNAGPATWTVAVFPLPTYAQQREQFATRHRNPPAGGLSPYWRDDFEVQHLGAHGPLYAVHHKIPFEAITVFEADARRISYVLPEGARLYLPHLEHLVGHVLRLDRWMQGFVDLHAAFVRYLGKGVALIGPRRAGKTSLAMHFLARGGDLLGSDMAQIRFHSGGWIEAASIPHLCRITRETIWDNRLLAQALGSNFEGNADYLTGPLFSYGKYEMYDRGLELVLERPVGIASMRLDAIFFPHFDRNIERATLTRAAPREGVRRLIRSVDTDRPLADWLPFDVAGRQHSEAEFARQLVAADVLIPAFDLSFGQEPSLDRHEVDAAFDTF